MSETVLSCVGASSQLLEIMNYMLRQGKFGLLRQVSLLWSGSNVQPLERERPDILLSGVKRE